MAKCPKCDEEIPIDATEEKDKIEIWRYFREKGDADKGRMVTIATWLLSLAIAILAYLAKNHYVFDPLPFCVKKPYSATIFAVFGIVISIYTLFIVIHLRRQTYKNWLRAELMFNKLQDTSILRQAMDRLVENLKPKKSLSRKLIMDPE